MENRVFGHNLLQSKELIAFYWWINFLSSRGAEPVVFPLVFAGVRRFDLQFEDLILLYLTVSSGTGPYQL